MIYDTISDAITISGGADDVLGRIDQYELLRELGGGGFGTVYLAKDTVSGVEVAVKGLPPIVRNNREELENVRSNFALVSRLSHTNIAKALVLHPAKEVSYASEDVRRKLRVSPGDFLMVMEYAPGVTLSQWRRQFPGNKVPVAQALDIVRQIASAIDYAHGRRIVHRDIKPANVMMETAADGKTVARILDFGLAAEIRSSMGRMSREIHDTSGTRPYMAPEQWLGGKQGPATDQYALAVLFHELLTGEVPFSAVFDTGDPVVMMNVVGRERFTPPQDLPKHIRLALWKALAKNPEERFASCSEFVDALEGKVKSFSRKESKRNKGEASGNGGMLVKVLLSTVVVAVVGIGGWWWINRHDGMSIQVATSLPAAQLKSFGSVSNDLSSSSIEQSGTNPTPSVAKMTVAVAEHKTKDEHERVKDATRIARRKSEVYVLKGKASQAQEKNLSEEWSNWPNFDVKAKELEAFYRAGVTALDKEDYDTAQELFELVRDNWYWLSTNKVNRAKALVARTRAEAAHKDAIAVEAGEFAKSELETMEKGLANAERAFSAAQFLEAEHRFDEVSSSLTNVVATARRTKKATHARLALQAFENGRYDEGFRYSQTADTANKELQFFIGECHAKELGGATQDWNKAGKWYHGSATQGYAPAEREYGKCCGMAGRGFNVNEEYAFSWYKSAAEHGDPEAMELLAQCYEKGSGVAIDNDLSAEWYEKAIEKGRSSALAALTRTNTKRAISEFKAGNWSEGFKLAVSADSEDGNILFAMGKCYETGNGVEKNLATASAYYAKSATAGVESAKVERARVDTVRALSAFKEERWEEGIRLSETANQSNGEIHFLLGKCFEEGLGLQKNLVKATEQYAKAADLKYNDAVAAMYRVGKVAMTVAFEAKDWERVLHFTSSVDTNDIEVAKQIEISEKEFGVIAVERRYQDALRNFNIDIDDTFPADKIINVQANADLPKILNDAPSGSTLKLAPGEYCAPVKEDEFFLYQKFLIPQKSLRIIGTSSDNTKIQGGFYAANYNSYSNVVLALENVSVAPRKMTKKSFWGKEKGLYNHCVWWPGKAVIKGCVFENGGIMASNNGGCDSSYMVLSKVRLVDKGFSITSADGKIIITDSEVGVLMGMNNKSRIYADNVIVSNVRAGGYSLNNEYRDVKLFLRDCVVLGDITIMVKDSQIYLQDVKMNGGEIHSCDNGSYYCNNLFGECKMDDNIRVVRKRDPIPFSSAFFK